MFKLRSISIVLISCIQFSSLSVAEEALDPDQLFKEAMLLKNSGQIFSAIEIFETLLSQQPGLSRAKLELATAYHQSRRFIEAKKLLSQVLSDPETPETVKLTITGYLAQLGSDEKAAAIRTTSSVYISAGLFNDSNVNLGPNAELPGATIEQSGSGIIAMASYSHVSRSSSPIKTKQSLIDIEWNTQISAYDKTYTSSPENDFNLQVFSLSTGPALVADGNWSFQFNIKLDKILFGGDPYSFNIGLNPKLSVNFDNDLQVFVESLTTVREFSSTSDQRLDGIAKMYGVGASKFFNNQTLGLNGGLRYHSNGADNDELNANGMEVYLGMQTPVWANARAYLELNSRQYDYKSGIPIIRDETEQRILLGLSHDFKTGLLNNWTLNTQFTHTENDSNDPNFDYDRDVFEANIRRYF